MLPTYLATPMKINRKRTSGVHYESTSIFSSPTPAPEFESESLALLVPFAVGLFDDVAGRSSDKGVGLSAGLE